VWTPVRAKDWREPDAATFWPAHGAVRRMDRYLNVNSRRRGSKGHMVAGPRGRIAADGQLADGDAPAETFQPLGTSGIMVRTMEQVAIASRCGIDDVVMSA
jgi:hypothetical protein